MSAMRDAFKSATKRLYQDGTTPTALMVRAVGDDAGVRYEKGHTTTVHMKLVVTDGIPTFVRDESRKAEPMSDEDWAASTAASVRGLEGETRICESLVFETMFKNILLMACHTFANGETEYLAYQVLSVGDIRDLIKVDEAKYRILVDDTLNAFISRYNLPDEDIDWGIFGDTMGGK